MVGTDAFEKSGREPARVLVQQYNAITVGGALTLLVLVTVLFYFQFTDLRTTQISRMDSGLDDRTAALDSFLTNTTFYVGQLKNQAEYALRQEETGRSPLFNLPRDVENGRFFAIDEVPAGTAAGDIGNMFGLGSYQARVSGARAAETAMALSLFPTFHATHAYLNNIVQSYYQSVNGLTAMYPWTSTADLLAREPGLTIEALIGGVLELDFMVLGRPENNPKRTPFWTRVYEDPAGKGLMVTHGVPVDGAEGYLGVVATDITLGALDRYVDHMDYETGMMLVVNQYGQVLANSEEPNLKLRPLDDVLPPGLETLRRDLLKEDGLLELGDYVVAHHRLASADWTLLFLLPKQELNRLSFFGIWGYVAIVLGLCLFLTVIYFMLQQRFVRPALALTDHIRAEAADGKSHVTDVPPAWRPWFRTISDTFALKHVTANLPGAVYQLKRHRDGRLQVVFISSAIREMVGVAPEDLMGGRAGWEDLFLAEDLAAVRAATQRSAAEMSPFHFRCRVQTPNGKTLWVRFSSNPRVADDGGIVWEGLILDITKRKLAEEALQASEQRLRSIMDASLFPLVVSSLDASRLVFINDRAQDLFGLRGVEAHGIAGPEYWVDQTRRSVILATIRREGMVENVEVEFRRRDGSVFWALMSAISMVYEGQGAILFTYTDITRGKELETELKRLATTDPLTGANNRRYFLHLGEGEWARAERGVQPLSVLMVDIDFFKRINDNYGHPAGDEVLRQVVVLIKGNIRNFDIFGRLGGEEFALILPNSEMEAAKQIGNRLREEIAGTAVAWEGKSIRFTTSIGVATYCEGDGGLEDLLGRADQALYEAKGSGRNRVVCHDVATA